DLLRVLHHRHRRRGDAGLGDRRLAVHAGQHHQAADGRLHGSGAADRQGGGGVTPQAKPGMTSAANSRSDFCASAKSRSAKLTCSEACSNGPIASTTRAMMSRISAGVPTQAPPDATWLSMVKRLSLAIAWS